MDNMNDTGDGRHTGGGPSTTTWETSHHEHLMLDVESCDVESQRILKRKSVEFIRKIDTNQLLKGVSQLWNKGEIEGVNERCQEVQDGFYDKRIKLMQCFPADRSSDSSTDEDNSDDTEIGMDKLKFLKQDFEDKIWKIQKESLELTYSMRSGKRRLEELADTLLYIEIGVEYFSFLLRLDKQPSPPVKKLLNNLFDPLNSYDFERDSLRETPQNWDELCCAMLGDEDIFTQFTLRINDNQALVYFLQKHPRLLFIDECSSRLIERLLKYLPFHDMNEVIAGVCNENGQTRMFVARCDEGKSYVQLYKSHIYDLYTLLALPDSSGKKALDVNTQCITSLLADTYNPNHQIEFFELIKMLDNITHFLIQHPRFLFIRGWSNHLLDKLVEYLEYDKMNEVLKRVRDENEQTCMFTVKGNKVHRYIYLYMNHIDGLYNLLLTPNIYGQTALHVNNRCILELLSDITYTTEQFADLFKLLSIQDACGNTCLFYLSYFPRALIELYVRKDRVRDLYNILSIQNRSDQTALHMNAFFVAELLGILIQHDPNAQIHYCYLFELLSLRDKNGDTCMFFIESCQLFSRVLLNAVLDPLYELLSIQNKKGQTALHVNTWETSKLLAYVYTPRQRDAFINIASIMDLNNKSARQFSNDESLRSLTIHVCENKYVIEAQSRLKVIIIYNTNNRSGAEEEAKTIYAACDSRYDSSNFVLKKNQTEEDIIDLIKTSANEKTSLTHHLPSSLVVILMSLGSVGTIDDCDGKPIKLSDIEEVMCSDALDGRPKLLIAQCCQNGTTVPYEKEKTYQPTHADFCAVMSCVAGEKSTRGVFLRKLAEQIEHCERDTNIFKIVNLLSKEMEREGHKQTPIIMSNLKAEFCPTDDWRVG